ncbi:MAG: MerR family transcriptional regulator, partial [Syntrophales bacterium]|nr:MerR family transcriptional regulator [Syntrophales bacterium]
MNEERKKAQFSRHMRISELSDGAQTPTTTIKYYLRKGLLPTPIRTGKTMSYYTEDHLQKLLQIKN